MAAVNVGVQREEPLEQAAGRAAEAHSAGAWRAHGQAEQLADAMPRKVGQAGAEHVRRVCRPRVLRCARDV